MNLPPELTELRQWVLWRYEQREGKSTKTPYSAMGYRASVTNSEHWSSFDYLMQLLAKRPDFASGIGFVFTADDPFCGIDLDDCWPSDAAETAPWAEEILQRFGDTYNEQSPSERGAKIWSRARAPRCGKWPVQAGAIEIYDHSRYFTVTGRSNGLQVITDHQDDVETLIAHLDQDSRPRPQGMVVPLRIPQGQRHDTLVSLAGTMHRRGMAPDAIEAALQLTNERQCDPPYPTDHVAQIVRSTERWER